MFAKNVEYKKSLPDITAQSWHISHLILTSHSVSQSRARMSTDKLFREIR